MKVSACIPVYNGRATLAAAIQSVREQTLPVAELLVLDDGSDDGSAELADAAGARAVRHERNLGRGAARATATLQCTGDLILCCDAGAALGREFLERALPHMHDPTVAAVFGRVVGDGGSVAHRWRRRHLFKSNASRSAGTGSLTTTGALLRRGAVLAAGNFDARLRQGEDAELGRRLEAAGHRVLFDPSLEIVPLRTESVSAVLRRYARWNGLRRPSWADYLRYIGYGVKVMVREDLREKDLPGALISLLCPHVLFWEARRASTNGASR